MLIDTRTQPALFIGRFQPFHKAHLEAIKWILKRVKKILIIIGSAQEFSIKENPFSFKERKEMIENALLSAGIKNFKIYGMPDVFDDVLWVKNILKITKLKPKEPIVFTRNSWIKKCFKKIKVRVKALPLFLGGLSATQIREKNYHNRNWENLVPKEILIYLKTINGERRVKLLDILPEKKIINFIKEKLKETGAKGGIVGVSGGVDSAVTASLTKAALGKKAILLYLSFSKNCPFEKNILFLEKKIKIKIKKIYLDKIYGELLKILPKGKELSRGNLKSRLRMATLYYFANLYNLMVIGTTNKSEMELGYFTKYGDGGVDIYPLGDLYKTEVIEMAERLKLPKEIIKTAPTANLWKGQTDEKEIGLNYQKLDTVLKLLNQGFKEKEISLLTNIPQNKIKNITERKMKNAHKLFLPPVCKIKF